MKAYVSLDAKTIAPAPEELDISYYVIKGEYEKPETSIEKRFSGNVCVLDNLLLGNWVFYVEGYNQEDILIAKSDEKNIAVKVSSDNSATFRLNYADNSNNGNYSISISWDASNVQIATIHGEIKKESESILTQDWILSSLQESSALWEGELPFGNYEVLVTAKDASSEIIGSIKKESLNIHSGFESKGTIYIPNSSQVDTPVITPDTGWITSDTLITITTSTDNAEIYYTTDGSNPDCESDLYTVPFKANGIDTIKAIAVKDGLQDSVIESAKYKYKESTGITVIKPENPIGLKIKIKEASEYDAIYSEKPFAVDVYDANDDVVDVSDMDASYKWYVDGQIYNDIGLSTESIKFSDYIYHNITVIADINGKEVSDTLTAKLRYIGPAGGYVFYDCDADNDKGNADGLISSECGWRYLEAAPNDLRVVSGTPTVDSSATGYATAESGYIFGYYRASSSGSDLYVNGTTTHSETDCTVTEIGSGEKNTEKLVNAMGESAYSYLSGSGKTSDYAARLCSVLSHGGYDDWFLPSKDELDLMYDNLYSKWIGSFSVNYYWSSSELNYDAKYACYQRFSDGNQGISYGRSYDNYIRPCRAF